MACIPADSKAFIKPFEGTDVTCLVADCVVWFGADEISSILNLNLCNSIKHLPYNQKCLWKDLEPQVNSEKQFVSGLGVRLLIAKTQEVGGDDFRRRRSSRGRRRRSSHCNKRRSSRCGRRRSSSRERRNSRDCLAYYNNTPLDIPCAPLSCTLPPRFELSECMHKLGNIFINEAIYDSRAYPDLDNINYKINKIYDLVLDKSNVIT
ncbi:ORF18 [Agrotis segetum granulovirus]|uniref:ORF18 n=1 Tax=Agrotis segetum granulosis virus TaxID=10464 RepID=Q9WHF2_GVAS|nr:hypothetical protein AsGV019 [Agrotis segetum granulovirus]AAD34381.1 unknown [Agrotis segetum granulovirus]AAS82720.1 ORF18 [Agrotis segetum granulovirus]AHN92058.1 pep-1 [Agrotis segetum granulovirus]AKN63293.1 hypothetical protein AsGV019 [Agrotis segetum granulovirus]